MKKIRINTNSNDQSIFRVNNGHNEFNQLAVKIDMDGISDRQYFDWLDKVGVEASKDIRGITFLEKEGVRKVPPINTAVYYDTKDYRLLPTGALLRTSCSILTHAFCAFKMPEDSYGNRLDRRHVFEGKEKKTIQLNPYSQESIDIVKNLLSRNDIEHPGVFLRKEFGITHEMLFPSMILFGKRSTFFVRIDNYDVLRCSIDRSEVIDYRRDYAQNNRQSFRECEISIYPRISEKIIFDQRVTKTIEYLVNSLSSSCQKDVIYDIKYQRGAKKLGFYK